MKFWVHSENGKILTAGGYETSLNDKIRLWPDKESVLKHVKKAVSNFEIRDLGNRVEVDLPADVLRPARTLAWTEFEVL